MNDQNFERETTIAMNFNIKSLKDNFAAFIEKDKPKTKEQWEQVIEDAINSAHEEAWTVFRYDERVGEYVFVNLTTGLMKYECMMDNEALPKLFDRQIKWIDIKRKKRGRK
ncbi:hypothetical protein PACILC2_53860 [Paenibacillus cisolokensis]|uniref:Uncharacterized protein n=1 Tax=Paenibacillus cisolokensis TaxID=1658519 RepID=A0ABQ4NF06_9BACL|nr:hypothetical protein [Paenibacillus cisolokensis]GIQ66818.1 hypothetical protein PACILC2_53860 [Paenibacillus cisolokensis]